MTSGDIPHKNPNTDEHDHLLAVTADIELGTFRASILEALGDEVAFAESKAVYPAVVQAFASGKVGKRESPLALLNHILAEAIVLDEALNGRNWGHENYDTALRRSLAITNTMAIGGFVSSFLPPVRDEMLPTRTILSARNADTSGIKSPKRLAQLLSEEYLDSDEWQEESLAKVAITAAFLTTTIYARAARSGNKRFITSTMHELRLLYTKFYSAHPTQDALKDRARQEVGRLIDGEPNELVDLLAFLEDDAPLLARCNLIVGAFATLNGSLNDLTGDIKGSQDRMRTAASSLLATTAMPEFIDSIFLSEEQLEADTSDDMSLPTLEFKPMELAWEVLPPGELETHARNIVTGMSNGHMPEIDLERLRALDDIRNVWGTDNCYYARGRLGRRHIVRDGQDLQPDEYIMLILQERDSEGNLRYEHALAESPIVGPHAMYIFRQDVNPETNWREVMAIPKQDARAKGARAVKHLTSAGLRNLSMVEKAELLLMCTTDEFKRLQFNGIRGFRLPKDALEVDNAASSSES